MRGCLLRFKVKFNIARVTLEIIALSGLLYALDSMGMRTGFPRGEINRTISAVRSFKSQSNARNAPGPIPYTSLKSLVLSKAYDHVVIFNVEGGGYDVQTNNVLGQALKKKVGRLGARNTKMEITEGYWSGANTIKAELEYLCGKSGIEYTRNNECIPKIAADEGYTTHYYHSNDLYF